LTRISQLTNKTLYTKSNKCPSESITPQGLDVQSSSFPKIIITFIIIIIIIIIIIEYNTELCQTRKFFFLRSNHIYQHLKQGRDSP